MGEVLASMCELLKVMELMIFWSSKRLKS